jgi:uncharacterized protein RhaS with RHS repeats
MHARYYSPGVRRFLTVDPVISEAALSIPQRWNRYTYVSNNPLRFTDPTGQYVCKAASQVACDTIELSMKMMRFAAARMSFADGRTRMQKVVNAYGNANDPTTKISTVWVDPKYANGAPMLQPDELGRALRDGSVMVSLLHIHDKYINSNARAFTALGGTLTHEGDHALRPGLLSLPQDAHPSRLALLYYEYEAYKLEKAFYGLTSFPGMAPDPIAGATRSADRDCSSAGGCDP